LNNALIALLFGLQLGLDALAFGDVEHDALHLLQVSA
jgi:hypothetical protein